MVGRTRKKLNRLEDELPEGLLVDAAWLRKRGYSRQMQNHYVSTRRLEQPARGLFRRPRGSLTWQQVVISLRAMLNLPVAVGGRTALGLQGFVHYLQHTETEVHLYGSKTPPTWLTKLSLDVRLVFHNDKRLFRSQTSSLGNLNDAANPSADENAALTTMPWGAWAWPLPLSTPERAILELLDELPDRESFHQVDKLFEGLTTLRPQRLQKLLTDCKNVKVKRLFFFFADRHHPQWLKKLDKNKVDLGNGNRVLVKGGKLDRIYQITVPKDLNGVQ